MYSARYYSLSTMLIEDVTSAALDEDRIMRLAKSGSISVSAAKRQTQKITKNEKRSDRTKCRNLLEAQLTKRFIPLLPNFD